MNPSISQFNSAFTTSTKMKREGRQHGTVRTYRILPSPFNPRPKPRFVNRLDSPPTAGVFTKVSTKPTNHSKFTGKCAESACKSKEKAKVTQKQRSCDAILNYKSISWRVMDGRPGLKFARTSATGMLDNLSSEDYMDDYEYDDDDDDDCVGEVYEIWESPPQSDEANFIESSGRVVDDDDKYYSNSSNNNDDYDDDGWMRFTEVGFVLDRVDEDDDWCLVEEME